MTVRLRLKVARRLAGESLPSASPPATTTAPPAVHAGGPAHARRTTSTTNRTSGASCADSRRRGGQPSRPRAQIHRDETTRVAPGTTPKQGIHGYARALRRSLHLQGFRSGALSARGIMIRVSGGSSPSCGVRRMRLVPDEQSSGPHPSVRRLRFTGHPSHDGCVHHAIRRFRPLGLLRAARHGARYRPDAGRGQRASRLGSGSRQVCTTVRSPVGATRPYVTETSSGRSSFSTSSVQRTSAQADSGHTRDTGQRLCAGSRSAWLTSSAPSSHLPPGCALPPRP